MGAGGGTVAQLGRHRYDAVNRDLALDAVRSRRRPYDIVVIGGGATGAGIALDAASRKLDVLLLEARDFGSGTSSRSTKIIHGGVRYLAQGRVGLVREALRERAFLLRNAAHLVRPLAFVVPVASAWEQLKYFVGLHAYDALAGSKRMRACSWLGQRELAHEVAGLDTTRLNGAMRYFDGQFDDARLLINILDTAVAMGANVINYAEVVEFGKDASGQLRAVTFRDAETRLTHEVEARIVINATGAASDTVLSLDDSTHTPMIMPSQGAHIVVAAGFLPGDNALLLPRTPDGRIMFAIPWLDHVLIGTTDTALPGNTAEPTPLPQEIDMILDVAGRYLKRAPTRADVLATFAGVRPLVRSHAGASTAQASREHRIEVFPSGLISISGGKWTTYRLMAEQCVDIAAARAGWPLGASATATLRLRTCPDDDAMIDRGNVYGRDADDVAALSASGSGGSAGRLHAALPYRTGECLWAIRHEMARRIDDVLARRTRALFLDARAAVAMAPLVAELLRKELQLDDARVKQQLDEFTELAAGYQCNAPPR
jgi:glycerol-3-phosphate dehydrogenase